MLDTYKKQISEIIGRNFQYVKTWHSEIGTLSPLDATLTITKKNFLIIGINSINEFLLEQIIYLYYELYLADLENETGFKIYSQYELKKVEKIISSNHDGSFSGFISMTNQIFGNVIGKGKIEKFIEEKFIEAASQPQSLNFNDFKSTLGNINSWRNQIGHNSEAYFSKDKNAAFNLDKFNLYIATLENGFIGLGEFFFEAMSGVLDFKHKTMTKFPDTINENNNH